MFRPASFFIGLRYTRAKRRNHFISFIALVSMIGIALGVMVLITVLSVMNGFDREIKNRVFSMVSPMTVSTIDGTVDNWQHLQKQVNQFASVKASAPFVLGEILISNADSVQPAMMTGILPKQERTITELDNKMVRGDLSALQAKKFGIVLGENLADRLRVDLGDKVTVITPQVSLSPAGVIPRFKRFTVIGVFRAGNGFGFDGGLSFINLNDAQKLLGLGENISGLHVNIDDIFKAPQLANQLKQQLNENANVTTWADQFGEFFHAIKLEKTMMFFILLLIVAVAAFNLVSTLVMVVNDKQADIAILRTFGATPKMIMAIFMIQGGLVGFFGTLIGVVAGVALAANVTVIVNNLEQLLHIQFISSNIYFVNYLPSEIQWLDVLRITAISLSLSLLAIIYPAYRAAKMDPVESLRYE